MPRITLSKKPKMLSNTLKIKRIRQRDITKERPKLLKNLSKKKHNKLRKDLETLLEIFLKEDKISKTLPIKSWMKQRNSSEIKRIKQKTMLIKRPDNQETFWMKHQLLVLQVEPEIMCKINLKKPRIFWVKKSIKLKDMLTQEKGKTWEDKLKRLDRFLDRRLEILRKKQRTLWDNQLDS